MMAVLAWVAIGDVQAQAMTQAERRARVDSVLAARYYRTPYDTNFVARPEGKLTLKVRMNQTGNTFHAKGTVNDIHSKADLKTGHKTTFSLAAIYRGIGVGVAVNPAKWKGVYKDYEFTTTAAVSVSTSVTSDRNLWPVISTVTIICRDWSRVTSR